MERGREGERERGKEGRSKTYQQVPHDLDVALADGRGEGREDAAVAVLDADAGAQQQLDALELVRHDGHLHDALEGAGLGQRREEPLQDRRLLDRHADRPVLASDVGVGAAGEEKFLIRRGKGQQLMRNLK